MNGQPLEYSEYPAVLFMRLLDFSRSGAKLFTCLPTGIPPLPGQETPPAGGVSSGGAPLLFEVESPDRPHDQHLATKHVGGEHVSVPWRMETRLLVAKR